MTTTPFIVFDTESEIERYLRRGIVTSKHRESVEATHIKTGLIDFPRARPVKQEDAENIPEVPLDVKTEDKDVPVQLPPKKRLRCDNPARDSSLSCVVPLPRIKPEPVEQDEVGLNPAAHFFMAGMFGLSAEYMLDNQPRISFFKHTREDIAGADFHRHVLLCKEDDMNREICFEGCHANVMASSSLSGYKGYSCEQVVREMHEAVRTFMRDDGGSIRNQERIMCMGPYAS